MPKTVGVAVSNATFHFDKLYTYAVMPDQQDTCLFYTSAQNHAFFLVFQRVFCGHSSYMYPLWGTQTHVTIRCV